MHFIRFSTVSLRVWIGFSIVLMTICLIMVLTLSNMAPRVTVLPQLFSQDTMRFGQFVEATNLGAQVKEKNLIEEMLLRFYVENRHFYIPDGHELVYRYGGGGPIARLSQPNIYLKWVAGKGNYLERLQESTETTTVDIVNFKKDDKTFTIDFDVYRFNNGQQMFGGRRRATIRVGYDPRRRSFGKDFANPYGLFVWHYDETALKK